MLDDRHLSELQNSWLNQRSSMNFDPTRSHQIVPSKTGLANVPGPPTLYHPQMIYNDRQHTKTETRTPPKSPTKQNNIPELIGIGTAKKTMLIQIAIGTMIGLVICGVPLAVMTTLYVQATSSSAGTNSSSSGGSSVTLPSQCTSYTTNFDATRNVGYTGCINCNCDSSLSAAWYRFVGGAGTALITSPVSTSMCGASYTGWFNGTFPTTAGATTYGTVCVNYQGNLCYSGYTVSSVAVTNCNGFYVFYLTPMSACAPRYCTT